MWAELDGMHEDVYLTKSSGMWPTDLSFYADREREREQLA